MTEVKPSEQHSHPIAAGNRSVANIFIDNIIEKAGYLTYSVSMSARDQRAGNAGNRMFYFSKDLAMDYRNDKLNQKHCLKMIDVDYYCDMRKYAETVNPMFLYTFVPLKVAGKVPNGTYNIFNDKVNVKIHGVASYHHKIWDYDTDSLIFDYWWGSVVYLVEQRMTDDATRRIIGLFPTRVVYGPLAWLLPGKRLNRREFNVGDLVSNTYQMKDNDLMISFKSNADHLCATVPLKLYQTALIRCGLAKDPSISDVERIFRTDPNIIDPTHCASLFISLYLRKLIAMPANILTVPNYNSSNYQTLYPLVTEDGKPSVRVVGPAYTNLGFGPMKSYNNDNACVQGRIINIKNKDLKVPPFYHQCMTEFLNFLIPVDKVHTGVPYEEKHVEDLQNRPTQRAQNEATKPFSFLQNVVVKAFQKSEVYSKIQDPRNISTLNADHRLRYSSYIYSIKSFIKQNPWYAFGKHPIKITERLRDVCADADWLIPTDFSRFDGTHGKFLADFEWSVLLRFFNPSYHKEVNDLQQGQFNVKAITNNGLRYDTGYSRLSGSSDTSDFNTLCNALVAYIAIRHTTTPNEAYNKMGLYGGDDGLTPNIPSEIYERVCTKLGLKLKAEMVLPGEDVTFLGRCYLDPWTTSESMCDIKRRLPSLHLSVTPVLVPVERVLSRKATGYLITDPTTPFISHWSKAILRIVKKNDDKKFENLLIKEDPWFSQFVDPYHTPKAGDTHMYAIAAQKLGISVAELDNYCNKLDRAKTLEEMDLGIIFDFERKIEVSATLKGDVLLKTPPVKPLPEKIMNKRVA